MSSMFRDERLNARVGRTLSQVPSDTRERIKKMGPSKCPECGKSLLERSRGGERPAKQTPKPKKSRMQRFKEEAAEFQRRRIDRIVK